MSSPSTFARLTLWRLAERRSILNNMASISEQYSRGALSQDSVIPMNPVRLCRLGSYMLRGQRQNNPGELVEEWQTFWSKTTGALREFIAHDFDAWEAQILADECLSLLDALDTRVAGAKLSYSEWLDAFDPNTSRFPEELFEQLDMLVPGETGRRHRRVRRLREGKTEAVG